MDFTVQDLIATLLPGAVPAALGYALAAVAVAFAVLSFFVAPLAGVTSWLERRVWARMQSRVGPNRVGPQGILQWLADGVKNIQKEDIIPASADRKLFLLAPYIVFSGFLGAFVVIPFGSWLIPRRPQHRHPLPVGHHLAGGGGHPDGGLVVQQQVVAAGGHALGRPDRQLRDTRRGRGADRDLPVRDPQHAGDHQGPGMGAVGLVHLLQPLHPGGLLPVLHGGPGRGQPHAVRHSRGRVRAGGRLRDRVQRHALPLLLLRGVGQPVRHRRHRGDAVPGRLADTGDDLRRHHGRAPAAQGRPGVRGLLRQGLLLGLRRHVGAGAPCRVCGWTSSWPCAGSTWCRSRSSACSAPSCCW